MNHLRLYFTFIYLFVAAVLISQNDTKERSFLETPLFSFGLIADIQYADAPTAGLRNYRGALSKLEAAVPIINDMDPEFVITLGDNIDRDYTSFDKILPLLDQIHAPVFNAIGNHDFSVKDQYKPFVRDRLKNARGYFSFVRSNYRFIILDGTDLSTMAHKNGTPEYQDGKEKLEKLKSAGANNARDWNGGIGESQLNWLEKQLHLADQLGEKVLLFCHWPLWPEIGTQLWNNNEVLKLLSRHPSVFAWISGHHHAGGYHLHKGVHHLTLKGMVESQTATSFGIMNVFEDRVELEGYGDQLSVVLKSSKNSVQKFLPSSSYHTIRSGLPNAYTKFTKEGKGRVAFLGGSITYNPGWRDSIMQYLTNRFPETDFDFVSAGIPSMGSTPAAFRIYRDVLMNGPVDLLFEEAAVNDATNGRNGMEQIRAMEGIVRRVRSNNPFADIVFMHFVDPQKMEIYRSGKVPKVIQNHEKVANHYNISTINLAKEVTERIDAREFTWDDDFKNLHPSAFGQGIYARSIIDFLESSWRKSVDGKTVPHPYALPEKIDPYSYDRGKLIEVNLEMETIGWRYASDWSPDDGAGTRFNYTDVPMLIGDVPNAPLTFLFQGRGVGLSVAAGPDAGIIEYRIDGGEWEAKDLYTRWSKGLHLPWYYTLASELQDGRHKLEVRMKKEGNSQSLGSICRIRYFYVNE